MTVTAKDLINLLDERELISAAILARLRGQVLSAKKTVSAERVGKLLVEKKLITSEQFDALLHELESVQEKAAPLLEVDTERLPGPPPTATDPKPAALEPAAIEKATPDAGSGVESLIDEAESDEAKYEDASVTLQRPKSGLSSLFSRKPGRGGNQWDSPLILVGGGALLLLLIVGGVLFLTLSRGTAEELLAVAEEDYNNGLYGQAIAKYERFLDKFSGHPEVSHARVRHGMSGLRRSVESGGNWPTALDVAQEILPGILNEEKFNIARPELASVLPSIAEGLADAAAAAPNTAASIALVDEFDEAMSLVNNPAYLPTSMRESQRVRIQMIEDKIKVVKRTNKRAKALTTSLEQINQAIAAGDARQAYMARTMLLKEYPRLENNEQLRGAVATITQSLSAWVKIEEWTATVSTDDSPVPQRQRIQLANHQGPAPAATGSAPAYVPLQGTIFAVDGQSGVILWSHRGAAPIAGAFSAPPLPISDGVLVAGRNGPAIQRRHAQSGDMIWLTELDQSPIGMTVVGDKVLATSAQGKLSVVNLADGTSTQRVVMPQPAATAVTYDNNANRLYQLGDHSNLYVFDSQSLACTDVVYVGHSAQMVATSPVIVADHVLVFENLGLDRCQIHVFNSSGENGKLQAVQSPLPLEGNVLTTPVRFGRNGVIVTTNQEVIYAIEIDRANAAGAAAVIATKRSAWSASPTEPVLGYSLVDGANLLIGSAGLSSFTLQPSLGQMPRRWQLDVEDVVVAPPVRFAGMLIIARRTSAGAGIVVSGFALADLKGNKGPQPRWTTRLAVGTIGSVSLDPDKPSTARVLTQNGDQYNIDLSGSIPKLIQRPSIAVQGRSMGVWRQAIALPGGRTVLTKSPVGDHFLLLDHNAAPSQPRAVTIKKRLGRVTAPPTAIGDGLAIPCVDGYIHLIDPETGKDLAHPFASPRLNASTQTDWIEGASIAAGSEMVIYDGLVSLFRLTIRSQPEPHLAFSASATINETLVSKLAVVGSTIFAVARSATDEVVTYQLGDLTPIKRTSLDGRTAWGPVAIGETVLLATDKFQLLAFAAAGTQSWVGDLEGGLPIGDPHIEGDSFWLSLPDGTVRQFALADGVQKARVDVGDRPTSGPAIINGRIVVATSAGSITVLDKPGA